MVISGLSGLINQGNTCWMNSIIQCISHSETIRDFFILNKYQEDVNPNSNEFYFLELFIKLIKEMWRDNSIIEAHSFKEIIGQLNSNFVGNDQQDAQEFFILLIDELHKAVSYEIVMVIHGDAKNSRDKKAIKSYNAWNEQFKKSYSFFVSTIYGQYNIIDKCMQCNSVSNKYEVFSTLELPIINNTENIYDCLANFTNGELLDGDNKVSCDKCAEKTIKRKRMQIWKTPELLCITLKRFDPLQRKIGGLVDFPLYDLNLEAFVNGYDKDDSIYDLYAVCNHIGQLNFGHYNAYCKNSLNNKWYCFNDEHIREIKIESIVSEHAYILFYKKRI
jgi:ubiquitin C-terminal hydrolase